ncbi:MAG: EamA family transporter [Candidatus Nanoarchaeia archaeon]
MDKLLIVLIMILSCAIGATGSLQLKFASRKLTLKIKEIHKNLFNKHLWLGIILYGISLCLVIFLFSLENLNIIYPLTSITYIFTIVLSFLILKEKITKYKLLALFFIVLGNVLITYHA